MIAKKEDFNAEIVSGSEAPDKLINSMELETVYGLVKEAKQRIEEILLSDPADKASDASPIKMALDGMRETVSSYFRFEKDLEPTDDTVGRALYVAFISHLQMLPYNFPESWGARERAVCYKAFRDAVLAEFPLLARDAETIINDVQKKIEAVYG